MYIIKVNFSFNGTITIITRLSLSGRLGSLLPFGKLCVIFCYRNRVHQKWCHLVTGGRAHKIFIKMCTKYLLRKPFGRRNARRGVCFSGVQGPLYICYPIWLVYVTILSTSCLAHGALVFLLTDHLFSLLASLGFLLEYFSFFAVFVYTLWHVLHTIYNAIEYSVIYACPLSLSHTCLFCCIQYHFCTTALFVSLDPCFVLTCF